MATSLFCANCRKLTPIAVMTVDAGGFYRCTPCHARYVERGGK